MSIEVIQPGFRIVSTGAALPETQVTNAEVVEWIKEGIDENDPRDRRRKASDRWIALNTGIITRYISDPQNENETTAGLSTTSGGQALKRSDMDPESIDLVIVGTMTPDEPIPPVSSRVQNNLGLKNAEFVDINLACTGMVRAISLAHGQMAAYGLRRIMIIGTDRMSAVTNYQDMMTAPLFGDGSGAVILEATEDERGIFGRSTDHQGEHGDKLESPTGKIVMQGSEIYKLGVKLMTENAINALAPAGLTPSDISRLVLHQANLRMMEAVATNLEMYKPGDEPMDRSRIPVVIDRYGNNTHATVALTLNDSVEKRPLEEGEVVVLDAVGGGVAGEALALVC